MLKKRRKASRKKLRRIKIASIQFPPKYRKKEKGDEGKEKEEHSDREQCVTSLNPQ